MFRNANDEHRRGLGFNERMGLYITRQVGTMWTAYGFAALALISLPAVILTGSAMLIVSWTAQTFLQLVLLPIILVGQNLQQRHAEIRAEVDSANLREVHALLEELAGKQWSGRTRRGFGTRETK